MRKIKQLGKLFLVAVLIVSCIPTAYGFTADNISDSPELYIQTTSCPSEYVTFATQNAARYVGSMDEANGISNHTFTLGSPFSCINSGADIFYFPIIRDEEIVYLLRVYSLDGQCSAVISSNMVDELNGYANQTSRTAPLALVFENGDILAQWENTEATILDMTSDETTARSIDNTEVDISDSTEISNVYVSLSCNNVLSEDTTAPEAQVRTSVPTSVLHTLDYAEQQTTLPWCSAYVTASLLRYITDDSSITARSIMTYYFGAEAENNPLSISNAINYANLCGLSNPTWTYSPLSREDTLIELATTGPFYMYLSRSSGAHAIACIGYSVHYYGYYVWNPWFTTYEVMSWNDTIYVPDGYSTDYTYTWTGTIYDWS